MFGESVLMDLTRMKTKITIMFTMITLITMMHHHVFQVAFHLIYPDQFPPRRLHHLARLLDSIPCESPHVVIGS